MSIEVQLGNPLPLELTLPDGDITKFPRAHVYNSAGTEVAGSPFALTHIANGFYRSLDYTPGVNGQFSAVFIVYDDAGFTTLTTKYGRSGDFFDVTEVVSKVNQILTDTDALETRLTPTRASNLDRLDANVSTRATQTDQATILSQVNVIEDSTTDMQPRVLDIQSKATDILTDTADIQPRLETTQTQVNSIKADTADMVPRVVDIQTETAQILADTDDMQPRVLDTQTRVVDIQGNVNAIKVTAENTESLVIDINGDTEYNRARIDQIFAQNQSQLAELAQIETKVDNLILNAGAFDANAFANEVWNKTRSQNNLVGSFGEALQQTVASRQSEATALVRHQQNLDTHEITQNYVGILQNSVNSLTTKTTNDRNQIIAEIDANELKLDQINSKVSGIQNNTDVIAIVPAVMVPPESGTKTYQFVVETFNDSNLPVNADSLPTVRILTTGGVELVAETAMSQDGIKTGVYLYDYVLTDAQVARLLRIEFKTIVDGVTKYSQRTAEIQLFDSTLEQIEAKIDIIDSNLDDLNNLATGANGLAQIKSLVQTSINEINANEVKIDAIKVKTDALPSDIARSIDVTAVLNAVNTKPDINTIQTRLNNLGSSIKGPDNRTLTEVYDNERGTDGALLASDPRLNFLDASISSRSSLTAAGVWSHVTRTLTAGAPLTVSDAEAVWNVLTNSIGGMGTVGARIKDFLDATVSSRSNVSLIQLQSELAPLAKELTVSTINSSVVNEANENQALLNQVISTLALIKPQTDKIIAGGATESNVTTQANQNEALLVGLTNLVNLVKAKTDNIPADVARQTTLLQVPTNPLRDTDARLNQLAELSKLDVAVSTRAASFPGDYATAAQIEAVRVQLLAEINQNELAINSLPKVAYFEPKFLGVNNELSAIKGSGFETSQDSLNSLRTKVNTLNPGATPAQIWSHEPRHLTAYPATVSPPQLDAAKEAIISNLSNYFASMSTIIDSTGKQTFLVWLNLNGTTIANTTNARVTVFDDNGQEVWAMVAPTPDSNGVFKLVRNNATQLLQSGRAYSVRIVITSGGSDHTTIQPFFTVG